MFVDSFPGGAVDGGTDMNLAQYVEWRGHWDRESKLAAIANYHQQRPNKPLRFEYRNHRGEVGWRDVNPKQVEFGTCEWHEGYQWLLHAWDHDKNAVRTFAVDDILRVDLEWED